MRPGSSALLALTLILAATAVPCRSQAHFPPPPHVAPLRFEDVIVLVHNAALDVLEARGRRGEVRAARHAAEPLLPSNPVLEMHAGPRFRGDRHAVDVAVSIHQRIEIAGERALRFEVADQTEARFEAELRRARWAAAQRAYVLFHHALVAREEARLAEVLVAFAEDLRASAGAPEGEGTPLLHRLAEVELDAARRRLGEARGRYEDARWALAELIGWAYGVPPNLEGDVGPALPLPSRELLRSWADAAHPELDAVRARIAEARARVDLEDREGWPEVGLGLGWRREGDVGLGVEHVVLANLSLPIPLFDRNHRRWAEAQARVEALQAEEDALERRLEIGVTRASARLERAAEGLPAQAEQVADRLSDDLRMIREALARGELGDFEVWDVVERVYRGHGEVLVRYRAYFDAKAALQAVVGRWLPPLGSPT